MLPVDPTRLLWLDHPRKERLGRPGMIINGCGAAYAKVGIAPAEGGFTQETACGDASAIAAG
jgi:hypothetical protein